MSNFEDERVRERVAHNLHLLADKIEFGDWGSACTLVDKVHADLNQIAVEPPIEARFIHVRGENKHFGGATVAYDVKTGAFAVALCSERDRFCRRTGRQLALERLRAHPGRAEVLDQNAPWWANGTDETFDYPLAELAVSVARQELLERSKRSR
jgi:hypothetical protein